MVSMRRQVFVTGATGYVGSRVVPALVARGHQVRALVRKGSEARAPQGCEVIVGDPLDGRSFAHHVAGCDTLLQLVGVPRPSPSKAQLFREVDLRSGVASVAAAQSSGVAHFVYVSVAHPAPVMLAYQEVRVAVEGMIAAAGLKRTIVRPWYVLGPGHRWPVRARPAVLDPGTRAIDARTRASPRSRVDRRLRPRPRRCGGEPSAWRPADHGGAADSRNHATSGRRSPPCPAIVLDAPGDVHEDASRPSLASDRPATPSPSRSRRSRTAPAARRDRVGPTVRDRS